MHHMLGIDYTFNHSLTDFCFDLGGIIGLIAELENPIARFSDAKR